MKLPLNIDMAEATRLTRLGRLNEAMAVLSGNPLPDTGKETPMDVHGVIDMTPPSSGNDGVWTAAPSGTVPPRNTAPLDGLMERLNAHLPKGGFGSMGGHSAKLTIPDGASFETHTFANAAGQRPYKLYIPAAQKGEKLPLVVMLHGCTQSPEDFAAGTRMNELAEELGFIVAYPGQTQGANAQKCWNWFNSGDQQRDQGEASIIAGLTREVMQTHAIDPDRVFIAGLSAGGAAAAIMGASYPELFAAIGVHSGLACGAAKDMSSAFGAMSKGASGVRANGRLVPTIVFHGDGDTTVHAINGAQVINQARSQTKLRITPSHGTSAGGVRYSRTIETDDTGTPVLEHWVLHGAGHAWSGGSAAGSYTDPRGPDASREMIRFFLDQKRTG
jgi:poly(hydroxyalkanoate) depolymerase family esterase